MPAAVSFVPHVPSPAAVVPFKEPVAPYKPPPFALLNTCEGTNGTAVTGNTVPGLPSNSSGTGLRQWTSITKAGTSTCNYDTSTSANGSSSINCTSDASGNSPSIFWGSKALPVLEQTTELYGRIYFNMPSSLPSAGMNIMDLRSATAGGNQSFVLRIDTQGRVAIRIGNAANGSGSVFCSLATWYRVEWHAKILGVGKDVMDFTLYQGNSTTSIDSLSITNGNAGISPGFAFVIFGPAATLPVSQVLNLDDIQLNTSTYPGPGPSSFGLSQSPTQAQASSEGVSVGSTKNASQAQAPTKSPGVGIIKSISQSQVASAPVRSISAFKAPIQAQIATAKRAISATTSASQAQSASSKRAISTTIRTTNPKFPAIYGPAAGASIVPPLVKPTYSGTPRFIRTDNGATVRLAGANAGANAGSTTYNGLLMLGGNVARLNVYWSDIELTAPTGSGTTWSNYVHTYDPTNVGKLDTIVQTLAAQGIMCILEAHQSSWGGMWAGVHGGIPQWLYTDNRFPEYNYKDGSVNEAERDWWMGSGGPTDPGTGYYANQQFFIQLWQFLVARYSVYPNVISYGVMNEPEYGFAPMLTGSPAGTLSAFQSMAASAAFAGTPGAGGPVDQPNHITGGALFGMTAYSPGNYPGPLAYKFIEGSTKANRSVPVTLCHHGVPVPSDLNTEIGLMNGTTLGHTVYPIIGMMANGKDIAGWPSAGCAYFATGNMDSYLDTWVTLFNSLPATSVWVRLWHEMNTGAHPWSGSGASHGGVNETPSSYITGWQYVVNYIRARCPYVRFVWCPSVDFDADITKPRDSWYPGNSYVDWVGGDCYGKTPNYRPLEWLIGGVGGSAPSPAWYNTWNGVKPLMLCETNDEQTDPSRATWFSNYATQLSTNYPGVKVACFWDDSTHYVADSFTYNTIVTTMNNWLKPAVDAIYNADKVGGVNQGRGIHVMGNGGSKGLTSSTDLATGTGFTMFGTPSGRNLVLEVHMYSNGQSPGYPAVNPGDIGFAGPGNSLGLFPGDDFYPDATTVKNKSGTTYTGTAANQIALHQVFVNAAANIGVPLFMGEFGTQIVDKGAVKYEDDITTMWDNFGIGGTQWSIRDSTGGQSLLDAVSNTLNAQGQRLAMYVSQGVHQSTLPSPYSPGAAVSKAISAVQAQIATIGRAHAKVLSAVQAQIATLNKGRIWSLIASQAQSVSILRAHSIGVVLPDPVRTTAVISKRAVGKGMSAVQHFIVQGIVRVYHPWHDKPNRADLPNTGKNSVQFSRSENTVKLPTDVEEQGD